MRISTYADSQKVEVLQSRQNIATNTQYRIKSISNEHSKVRPKNKVKLQISKKNKSTSSSLQLNSFKNKHISPIIVPLQGAMFPSVNSNFKKFSLSSQKNDSNNKSSIQNNLNNSQKVNSRIKKNQTLVLCSPNKNQEQQKQNKIPNSMIQAQSVSNKKGGFDGLIKNYTQQQQKSHQKQRIQNYVNIASNHPLQPIASLNTINALSHDVIPSKKNIKKQKQQLKYWNEKQKLKQNIRLNNKISINNLNLNISNLKIQPKVIEIVIKSNKINRKTTISTQSKAIQVQTFGQTDYLNYLKFRQTFIQSFSKLENKLQSLVFQQKGSKSFNYSIQQILSQYQQTFISKQHKKTSRQQRIINLVKQTQQNQKNLCQFLHGMLSSHNKSHQSFLILRQKYINDVDSTIQKINSILSPSIFESHNQQIKLSSQQKKASSINQLLDHIYQNSIKLNESFQNRLNTISQDLQSMLTKFHQYKQLLYQNNFLVFNCVKKLSSIPQLIYLILYDQKGEFSINTGNIGNDSNGNEQFIMTNEEKMKRILDLKCIDCYKKNQKMKILFMKSQQSMEIVQALKCLLKDPIKKFSTVLQIAR